MISFIARLSLLTQCLFPPRFDTLLTHIVYLRMGKRKYTKNRAFPDAVQIRARASYFFFCDRSIWSTFDVRRSHPRKPSPNQTCPIRACGSCRDAGNNPRSPTPRKGWVAGSIDLVRLSHMPAFIGGALGGGAPKVMSLNYFFFIINYTS